MRLVVDEVRRNVMERTYQVFWYDTAGRMRDLTYRDMEVLRPMRQEIWDRAVLPFLALNRWIAEELRTESLPNIHDFMG